jgi:hypothetical protein
LPHGLALRLRPPRAPGPPERSLRCLCTCLGTSYAMPCSHELHLVSCIDILKVASQGLKTKMNHKFGDLYESFVEWVYDHSDGPLGDVEFREFSEAYKLDGGNSFGLLRYCKGRGLLDDKFSTLGGPVANMTPTGIQWVEDRKRRRADPALRIAAARKGLLVWLWKQKQAGAHFPITEKFLDFDDSVFEGDRLQPLKSTGQMLILKKRVSLVGSLSLGGVVLSERRRRPQVTTV